MRFARIQAQIVGTMIALLGGLPATSAQLATSEWVRFSPDGKLVYNTADTGDRIMDFSHAGYMGGGVALPVAEIKLTLNPTGGREDSGAIQAAVDHVAAMPLVNGLRGAVLLAPGVFTCSKAISISAGGVVIRGSGSGGAGGAERTTIRMTGDRHSAFFIGRARQRADASPDRAPEAQTSIAEAYVPSGATSFSVTSAQGFAVGDQIAIRRPTTAAWVQFMRMHDMSRNGNKQTWIGLSRAGVSERRITAIQGNRITIDIPLADSYDAKFLNPPGTTVAKVLPEPVVTNSGIEHLHIECPPQEMSYAQAPYSAARINGQDCWMRDVVCDETMNSTAIQGKRHTLERVIVRRTVPNLGASKPADFSIEGSQILVDRCFSSGDNVYNIWTSSLALGPNAALNCTFQGNGRLQPHHRWSTGLLLDNCRIPDGGIDFMNRGVMGSGHGWTMAWAVAWNCVAKSYIIQNPPGAMNWAIGCVGERKTAPRPFDARPDEPEGTFDSHGTPVTPRSLYLAQLRERLGPQALTNIGYDAEGRSLVPVLVPTVATPEKLPAKVHPELGVDLAIRRPLSASSIRDGARQFAGERAVDGDDQTYWATKEGADKPALEVDLEGAVQINAVELCEAAGKEQQIRSYRVEGQVDSDWKVLCEGTTIGASKVHRFETVTAWKVRLVILDAAPNATIRQFGLYHHPAVQPSR